MCAEWATIPSGLAPVKVIPLKGPASFGAQEILESVVSAVFAAAWAFLAVM